MNFLEFYRSAVRRNTTFTSRSVVLRKSFLFQTLTFSKATIEALKKNLKICLKLSIELPKRRQWSRSGFSTAYCTEGLNPPLYIQSPPRP